MRIKISKNASEAKTFGNFIRLLRLDNNICARDLAKWILNAGGRDSRDMYDVDAITQRIYRWENRGVNPQPWALYSLAIILDVDLEYFKRFFEFPY
jgi:hypothetical protein